MNLAFWTMAIGSPVTMPTLWSWDYVLFLGSGFILGSLWAASGTFLYRILCKIEGEKPNKVDRVLCAALGPFTGILVLATLADASLDAKPDESKPVAPNKETRKGESK
jgi:ABC-type Co2+ transport system permease subunit